MLVGQILVIACGFVTYVSAAAEKCLPRTYSLVTGLGGLIVCPVAQSNLTIEGSGSLSNCLAWCSRTSCVTYTFHADTTNCEAFLYLPNYYEPSNNCYNYLVSSN